MFSFAFMKRQSVVAFCNMHSVAQRKNRTVLLFFFYSPVEASFGIPLSKKIRGLHDLHKSVLSSIFCRGTLICISSLI